MRVADNEFLTHQIYACLKQRESFGRLSALKLRELVQLFDTASTEDKDHYDEIIECVGRLKGRILKRKNTSQHIFGFSEQRHKTQDLLSMLRVAEERLIHTYTEICKMTLECDFRTFDLSYRNLHENLHHQRLVVGILTSEFPLGKESSGKKPSRNNSRVVI